MAGPLQVVFLWHMHQPYYVNPLTKTAMMPWVRLHAAKGYLDMIEMARRYPALRTNFNFTPVLVQQLQELASGSVSDLWEQWSRKPAAELDLTDRCRLLEHFFKIHWANLIDPFPRYRELLELRGRDWNHDSLSGAARLFSSQDLLDLQTWYNLNWCGFSAFRLYPELEELRRKGRGFTEEEKNRVLDIHYEIVRTVLSRYREAQDQGAVEITTTPFFHPIMPVVYDNRIAARAMPGREFPAPYGAPEDVRAHLRLAQELHASTFGRPARGMWPSEGSVAPEILPLMQEAGIEYFCTDEDILFRSLSGDPAWAGKTVDHLELFQPWACRHEGARVRALFRERPLSDFIGFNAARNSAAQAAGFVVHHLEHIAGVAATRQPVALLALDGENAWEAFPDGGERFLALLYEGVLASERLNTCLLGGVMDASAGEPEITRLHSGSWIGGNFDIWIGDPEENNAWDLVAQTREFLLRHQREHALDPAVADRAWLEIYAAEGSDWFWWYGPDFQNDSDMLFDELFRLHLQNVYLLLGCPPPQYLEVPVRQRGRPAGFTRPTAFISPRIDGWALGYFDWLGSGRVLVHQQQTAMFQADRMVSDIHYGFDRGRFYLRVDFGAGQPDEIMAVFCRPCHARARVLRDGGGSWEASPDGVHFEVRKEGMVEVGWGDRMELSIGLNAIGLEDRGEKVAFFVQIWKDGVEKERYPERGFIEFEGPSPGFTLNHWFI
ncbi:MAG: glycoside hydrolase family 57 protein [Candidatus Methylacidiphilales bacterium]|nr:glycoside hydrolase family 57 protein [Candidatus Methylacidiphilales bacterium]